MSTHQESNTEDNDSVKSSTQSGDTEYIFWKDWKFWTPTAISVMMQLYVCSVLTPFLSPWITPGNSTHVPCTPELSLPSCVNWLRGYQYLYIPWVAQIFNIFNTYACQVKNVSKKCSYILPVSLEFSFTWRRHHCRFRVAHFDLYLQTLCSDYLKPATTTVAWYTHSFGHSRGPVTPASIKQKYLIRYSNNMSFSKMRHRLYLM